MDITTEDNKDIVVDQANIKDIDVDQANVGVDTKKGPKGPKSVKEQDESKNLYDNKVVKELVKSDFGIGDDGKHLVIKTPEFQGKMGLIMVYAPWCPHCNSPKTTGMWANLADVTKDYFSIGAVNSENTSNGNDKLCEAMKIQGFPTIMVVKKNGHLHKYKGPRAISNILNYMCKKYKTCIKQQN